MFFSWISLLPLALVLCFALVSRSRLARQARGPLRLLSSHWSVLIFSAVVALTYWVLRSEWEPFALAIGAISLLPGGGGSDRKLFVERVLDHRAAPAVLGVLTAILTVWTWGSPRLAEFHDESAYRLQAGIFAGGRWAAPTPPLPEFFEQMHVLLTPARAAKYPPGHALLLAPGVWAGVPEGVPILLSLLSGALVFALARRVTNSYVGLLAWIVWVAAPGGMKFRGSYFSEVTTSFLWLAGWWALLRWRESRKRAWLLIVAMCVGWGAIARPLTMLVFAVPAGIAVLWRTWRQANWRDLAVAVSAGAAILLLIPLWSWRTTGDWKTTPHALYTRTYLPFDKPGFVLDASPPLRSLPPDIEQLYRLFFAAHREHTLANLGKILQERSEVVREGVWGGWRRPLVLFALVGLCFVPREAAFAAGVSVLLLLAYLGYAHFSNWSVYYLEMHSSLAFLTALGIWRMLCLLPARTAGRSDAPRPSGTTTLLALSAALALSAFSVPDIRDARSVREEHTAFRVRFQSLIAGIPRRAVVFVRYSPYHDVHRSLIENEADLPRARVWLVYDRGLENSRLMRLAPDRAPYLYDEATDALVPASADSPVPALQKGPA